MICLQRGKATCLFAIFHRKESSVKPRKNSNRSEFMRSRIQQGNLFLLPALLFTTALMTAPLVYVIILSFNKWNGSKAEALKYVGFDNYIKLWDMAGFKDMAKFTIVFSVATTFLVVILSLLLAFALDTPTDRKHVNRPFLRSCWYIPTLIGGMAVGIVWRIMYNTNNGIINTVLSVFGIPKIDWLQTHGVAGIAVIIAEVWVMLGLNIVIFLAGLQGVPQELYESAELAGATKWQKRIFITLPQIMPTITVVLISTSIASFKAYELPYTITQGMPGYSTRLVTQMIQEYSFQDLNYGAGAALSVILTILIIIIQLVQLVVLNKKEEDFN